MKSLAAITLALIASATLAQGRRDIPGKSVEEWNRLCLEGPREERSLACSEVAVRDSNPRMRAQRVELVSQQTMGWLAENDPDSDVRRLALIHLKDQPVLARIATGNQAHDERVIAVQRLDDQRVLTAIATSESDDSIRRQALRRVTDQGVLVAALLSTSEEYNLRQLLLERIGDRPDVFRRLALQPKSLLEFAGLHYRAAEKVAQDQSFIASLIGRYCPKDGGYCGLAELLVEPKLVEAVLERTENYDVIESLAPLAGQEALQRWVRHGKSPRLRAAAVKRTESLDLVNEALRNDKDEVVRYAAAERATDQRLLASVLMRDPSVGVRAVAAGRVADLGLVAVAVEREQNKDVALALAKRVTEPAVLRRWAESSSLNFPEIRSIALKSLGDPEFSFQVWQRHPEVGKVVAEQTSDVNRLLEILAKADGAAEMALAPKLPQETIARAAMDPRYVGRRSFLLPRLSAGDGAERYSWVIEEVARSGTKIERIQAFAFVRNKDVIRQIALNDPNWEIRLAAVGRLAFGDPARIAAAKGDADHRVRATLFGTRDPVLIAQLVTSSYADVRSYAIKESRDVELLRQIAESDPDVSVRKQAAERADYVARHFGVR